MEADNIILKERGDNIEVIINDSVEAVVGLVPLISFNWMAGCNSYRITIEKITKPAITTDRKKALHEFTEEEIAETVKDEKQHIMLKQLQQIKHMKKHIDKKQEE